MCQSASVGKTASSVELKHERPSVCSTHKEFQRRREPTVRTTVIAL